MRRLMTLPLLALATVSFGLTLGDKAPALSVAATVKGKHVDLSKGLHVVEFWATWCVPCKHAIPHLTELAEKYKGKLDFTGVSVSEHGDDQLGQVKKYVDSMGPKMNYNVAWDGPSGTMSTTWLTAAKQNGIPAAFLVKDGEILWIGHPMEGMQKAIDQTLAGTYNLAAEKEAFDKAPDEWAKMMQEQNAITELLKPVTAASKVGDYPGAIKALDEAEAKQPNMRSKIEYQRYNLLAKQDSPELVDLAKRYATEDYKDDAEQLNSIAWRSINPDSKTPNPHPNFEAAAILAARANEITKSGNAHVLNTLAYLSFHSGDSKKAVELEQKAIGIASAEEEKDVQGIKAMQGRLDAWSKASQ